MTMAGAAAQPARAQFTVNDLYLGFVEASANSDYIIDLGQPAAVGVGGTSVVNLSGYFSLSTFNDVFTYGVDGVSVAVLGADNVAGSDDVYTTEVRTGSSPSTPGTPGSTSISGKSHSTASMSKGASAVNSIMSDTVNGLPTAGNSAVDSTKSYYAVLYPLSGPTTFYVETGVNPVGTFGSSQIIYLDLYKASISQAYTYLGFFTIDLSTGTPNLTFTPSAAPGSSPPTAGFSGAPATGFAPLTVVFTNTSTGMLTNSVWNLGNGTILTNTTGGNVTNTYAVGGSYTVSLAVYGSAGSTTNTRASYIAVSPAPKLGILPLNAGKLTLSGSNGPVGVQYRVLTTTNLTLPMSNWTPVLTNTIPSTGIYGYTNNAPTNKAAYFRLVSP